MLDSVVDPPNQAAVPVTEVPTVHRRRFEIVIHVVLCSMLLILCVDTVIAGWRFRNDAFERSRAVRYHGDLRNAYRWGSRAAAIGVVKVYDELARADEGDSSPNYNLDYVPLRLLIVTQCVRWFEQSHTDKQRRDEFGRETFIQPMLYLNSTCELLASIAVFLLIRHWVVRSTPPEPPWPWRAVGRLVQLDGQRIAKIYRPYRGVFRGLLGFLLLWWNPGLIFDAHYYPQWDAWILPFALFALLAACKDRWFIAGALIGVSLHLKGQILFGAPLLLVWAIFSGRIGAVGRLLAGFTLLSAAVASPWLLNTPGSRCWTLSVAAAALVIAMGRWAWERGWRRRLRASLAIVAIAVLLAIGLLGWPFVARGISGAMTAGAGLMIVGAAAALFFLPWRAMPYTAASLIAATMFLSVPMFEGSLSWLRVMMYGARKYPSMGTIGVMNLCTLLRDQWGWRTEFQLVDLPWPFAAGGVVQVQLKTLMFIIYLVGLLWCGAGAAVHFRRNDRRFLVAAVTPWVLFFTVMPLMHSRYLIWGSSFACLFAALDVGMVLVALTLTWVSWTMIAFYLIRQYPPYWPEAFRLTSGMVNGGGWLLLGISALLLYVASPLRRANELPLMGR